MNLQRLVLLVAAVTAMLGGFLPWEYVYWTTWVNSQPGIYMRGWLTALPLIHVVMISLCGSRQQALGQGVRLAAVLGATLAALFTLACVWNDVGEWLRNHPAQVSLSPFMPRPSTYLCVGLAPYLVLLGSAGILLAALAPVRLCVILQRQPQAS